jgi:hypothetical protein
MNSPCPGHRRVVLPSSSLSSSGLAPRAEGLPTPRMMATHDPFAGRRGGSFRFVEAVGAGGQAFRVVGLCRCWRRFRGARSALLALGPWPSCPSRDPVGAISRQQKVVRALASNSDGGQFVMLAGCGAIDYTSSSCTPCMGRLGRVKQSCSGARMVRCCLCKSNQPRGIPPFFLQR